jgi:bacterioferritin (cytochrome b1)
MTHRVINHMTAAMMRAMATYSIYFRHNNMSSRSSSTKTVRTMMVNMTQAFFSVPSGK